LDLSTSEIRRLSSVPKQAAAVVPIHGVSHGSRRNVSTRETLWSIRLCTAPATTVEFRWSSDVEFGERTAVTGEFTMKALCTSGITSALKCTKSTSAISCE